LKGIFLSIQDNKSKSHFGLVWFIFATALSHLELFPFCVTPVITLAGSEK
jgi:hypothetical protein